MAIDFPNSPTTNQVFSSGGKTWVYDGTVWTLRSSLAGPGGITSTELANSSVTSAKIADGAIVNADINASAAVAYSKLALSNSVVNADINSSAAITYSKLALSNSVLSSDLNTDVQLGYRNVIINGAMQVAQRGTSTAGITSAGYYTADRWNTQVTTIGTWTQSVENDAPTGSGFRKSLKMLCTTADASPAASDFLSVEQRFEGQNLQQFLKGTASAKQFALSFWVKSNVTGTYIVEIPDQDNTRAVSASYTISASATWEKKTITFPADTTGAFDNDNAISLILRFGLGFGSTYTSGTLSTTWASTTQANRYVGQTNLAAATNNYWQITGVQLEAGAVATPFEFEDIGTTIAKCQRYYQKSYNIGDVPGTSTTDGLVYTTGSSNSVSDFVVVIEPPVEMRAAPTIGVWSDTGSSGNWKYERSGVGPTNTATGALFQSSAGFVIYGGVGASWASATYYGHYTASAEL